MCGIINPMVPWQKPHVERCHEFFRRTLSSGSSLDLFMQKDMTFVASHVNSYGGPNLDDRCPFDTLAYFYGKERAARLLRLLGHVRIPPEKIILSPALLKR